MFEIVQDVIEIREEAYKQNEVYRPWPAEAATEQVEEAAAPAAKGHQVKRVVSLASRARPQ